MNTGNVTGDAPRNYKDQFSPEDRTRSAQATQEGLDKLPFIACLCVTFCRPELLVNLIESFIRLDYPLSKRMLIILDDTDQYHVNTGTIGEGWEIISVRHRFRTLSAKRNALAAMCPSKVDAIAFWDDDDTFLPWTLHAHARALEVGAVSHPSLVMSEDKSGELKVVTTGSGYQSTQCIDLDLFETVGGFPRGNSGVDQQLIKLLVDRAGDAIDCCRWYPPWFVYGWHTGNVHLSTGGVDGYEGEVWNELLEARNQIGYLVPKWRRKWSSEVRNFLKMPLDLDTFAIPKWWRGTDLYVENVVRL